MTPPVLFLLLGCTRPVLQAPEAMHPRLEGTVHTDLQISLQAGRGRAELHLPPGPTVTVSLQGLTVQSVEPGVEGTQWTQLPGELQVHAHPSARVVHLEYSFQVQSEKGWLASGTTLTWPDDCGMLFPCLPDPAQGSTFSLEINDLPKGHRAIYPTQIQTPAPAYQLAWATGPYLSRSLGRTSNGLQISVWYLPPDENAALEGTRSLVPVMDWLETHLGPYAFGTQAGAVIVPQTPQMVAIEHHPFWHVSKNSAGSESVHAHEAAHGWLGNAVRIACWEDFVLSEGGASYLAAKALGAVHGERAEEEIWAVYQRRLDRANAQYKGPVLPESCSPEDAVDAGLFNELSYMRGAFFFREVEELLGVEVLLEEIGHFYILNTGKSVRMRDLITSIETRTGADLSEATQTWLTSH